MNVEIDDGSLNDDVKSLIEEKDGKYILDVSKIKSQSDIDRILQSKRHVDEELTNLKNKYRNVDVDQYNTLLSNQLEQNKDVLNNPVYKNLENKFNTLTSEYNTLKGEIAQRNAQLIDNEIKEVIRQNQSIQTSAVDDIFYRAKLAGFEKTEKGFLNKEGKTIDSFIEELKTSAKHLFKYTPTSKFNQENLNNALKNNDRKALFENLKTKN